uniref:DUF4283 domain-containing protein n=2 Tax=Lactuca sativa TaxID=4236 RepID=A0A9R1WDD1_LACSA|nr:hypothetical protein LSAT_V11C200101200 [Lactuca sativa]
MVNDEGFFFFKFDSKEGMMSVLEGGPWLINNVPMFVQRWRPGLVLSKPQINFVHVWVKVFNVPLEYWNNKGITLIANEIGKPIAMDKITQKMCNDHWGRPAFMRFLMEMIEESEWIKELSVVSIDFGTGEKVESKCRVEYAWRPDVCTHCKIYGHKNSNCGILNSLKSENKADEAETTEGNGKKEQIDDEGFILVTKKNNKGQQARPGVVIRENGKVDLIKSLEENTIPVNKDANDKKKEEIIKDVGNQEKQKGKQVDKQENQKWIQKEESNSKGADSWNNGGNFSKNKEVQSNKEAGNRNNSGSFSKFVVGNLKKEGKEAGAFQLKEGKNGKMNGTGVFLPKDKLGDRVRNVIDNFNSKKGEDQKKATENKKVYVPKKHVELKVSSNFDNIRSTSGKDKQEDFISKNPFDILNDEMGLRDMSYLDEMDREVITGGVQESNTKAQDVDQ